MSCYIQLVDRTPGPLARFGVLNPADAQSAAVVEIARYWSRSLPDSPTSEQVMAVMHGSHCAAWASIRHQLDRVPEWTAKAVDEPGHAKAAQAGVWC